MNAVQEVKNNLGVAPACLALSLARATYYRNLAPRAQRPPRPAPTRALSAPERQAVLDTLHADRFLDKAPAEVQATLLDEGTYLCSTRTMYRLLDSQHEVRERRNQLQHPAYTRPELLATAPNQVWSWDITKLRTFAKWSYLYLYVILDIFSRYAVGWMVAGKQSAALAQRLIEETVARQDVPKNQLILHSDRGAPMKAKTTAQLLADLGLTGSFGRPHVSDDNPFSESQFKTLKYRPGFPGRFGSQEEARSFLGHFFEWYNGEHRHSGLGMHTPASVHFGQAQARRQERQIVLAAAFHQHPERFVKGPPKPLELPQAVWINKPQPAPAVAAPTPETIPGKDETLTVELH
jgi:putative transposase